MADQSAPATFNNRLVGVLVAAGIITFCIFLLLSTYAGDFRGARDGRGHSRSVSAIGFRGLANLVDGVGGRAVIANQWAQLDTEDLVVVTVELDFDEEELAYLLDERAAKATLLIMPKWATAPDPLRKGWVRNAGLLPKATIAALLPTEVKFGQERVDAKRQYLSGEGLLEGVEVRGPAVRQTISGEAISPLLSAPDGAAVLARFGPGPLYILADPDIMNNQGMKDPGTARAALQILAALNSTGAETVTFDLTLSGLAPKPNVLKLVFEPPFLPLTIALLVAALLTGLHGAVRFGPETPDARAIAFGKLALVENSAGLIQLARREHRTGGAYAELVAESAAHASGAPASISGVELLAYLDRLSSAEGVKFSVLADRARTASNRHELLSSARALFLWKKEHIR